jgi:pimeloyl-ACP methyl ester carboxylesterase
LIPVELPESQWADLDGRVHWVDFGGPADGPLLVCVHGLGGSHVNWLAVAPLLTPTCRVVALDLAGFGHTPGHGRSTSVQGNQVLLHRFLTEVVGAPAILVGNSMGGLITVLETAAHPRDVSALVLIDPALPPDVRARPDPLTAAMFAAYFTPGVGSAVISRRRKGNTAEELAMDTLRLCCVDPGRVPVDVVRAHVELGRSRQYYTELEAEFVLATRSLLFTLARRRRFSAMLRRILAPVLLLHGEKDRLVSVTSARAAARAHPTWRYAEAPDVGHVPQLEVPEWTAGQILDWLGTQAQAAAREAGCTVRPTARATHVE